MKYKRLLCLGMAAVLACSGIPGLTASAQEVQIQEGSTRAAESIEKDGIKYIEQEDGTLSVSEYTGSSTDVVIPDEIDGKKVTSIGDNAFGTCINLASVSIPSSVTSIGSYV